MTMKIVGHAKQKQRGEAVSGVRIVLQEHVASAGISYKTVVKVQTSITPTSLFPQSHILVIFTLRITIKVPLQWRTLSYTFRLPRLLCLHAECPVTELPVENGIIRADVWSWNCD